VQEVGRDSEEMSKRKPVTIKDLKLGELVVKHYLRCPICGNVELKFKVPTLADPRWADFQALSHAIAHVLEHIKELYERLGRDP